MSVEEQARIARAAIEDAVDPLEAGVFVPRRRTAPVAALLLVAVALAGGLLAVTTLVGDGERDDALEAADPTSAADASAAAESDEVEDEALADPETAEDYWVLDPAPQGLDAIVLTDLALEAASMLFDVYGRGDLDNPFAEGAVIYGTATGLAIEADASGEPIDVDGTTIYASTNMLEWYVGDTAHVLLTDVLDQDTLIEAARSLLTEGELRIPGLERLAADVSPQGFGSSITRKVVIYGSPDDNAPFGVWLEPGIGGVQADLLMAAMAGFDGASLDRGFLDEETPATAAGAWEAFERSTSVVEGVGVVGITTNDEFVVIVGQIAGEEVILRFAPTGRSVTDGDIDRAIELFATARPATADEVDAFRAAGTALLEDMATDDEPAAAATGPYDGITDEGVAWQIIEGEDGVACVTVVDGPTTAEVCDFRDVVAEDGTTWQVSEGQVTVLVLPYRGERERGVRALHTDGTTGAVIPYERGDELLWYSVQREPVAAIEFLDPDDQSFQVAVPATGPADLWVLLAEPAPSP